MAAEIELFTCKKAQGTHLGTGMHTVCLAGYVLWLHLFCLFFFSFVPVSRQTEEMTEK